MSETTGCAAALTRPHESLVWAVLYILQFGREAVILRACKQARPSNKLPTFIYQSKGWFCCKTAWRFCA